MKNRHYIPILFFIISFLALSPLESGAYPFLKEVGKGGKGEAVLKWGEMPVPTPSRRQIIDADKGRACLQCHHMPYPIAPQKAEKPGEEPLSSIQTTPPGGMRLLTSLSTPISGVAGGWSPDGIWMRMARIGKPLSPEPPSRWRRIGGRMERPFCFSPIAPGTTTSG